MEVGLARSIAVNNGTVSADGITKMKIRLDAYLPIDKTSNLDSTSQKERQTPRLARDKLTSGRRVVNVARTVLDIPRRGRVVSIRTGGDVCAEDSS
jgi:hypothetical protein